MRQGKPKCKLCRRAGKKLFLKGAKCHSPKCPFVKRRYPPGFQGKKGRRRYLSEYGKELREKQRLRFSYNLKEKTLKRYAREALSQRGKVENSREYFIRRLEKRLDNTVYRLGFAESRAQARQLVGHGHFLVNGRKVDIPSYQVEKGDRVEVKESSRDKGPFQNLTVRLKNYEVPSWLEMDPKVGKGKVVGSPDLEEAAPVADIASVFEYYSR